ncbi:group III truncated hemoglobin [Arenicella xantha]|uniref:Hemoglobin n=1 Tax=Arenicella xantha TaxID=644221 RepID=A0A395JID9_9GAMM|nr:group III truncated hemoglobin [Arenicella xantha]RBP48366.1 hemoglobin [Arenicella xantha]
MSKKDVLERADIEDIVARFYQAMLDDPIIGYIFTDVAKVDLAHHLPVIVNFWTDIIFKSKNYTGNPLRKHHELHQKIPLTPGHFTRWLYLFNKAVDASHAGENCEAMKRRAEMVAKSISAAVGQQKRQDMTLVLPKD